MRESWKGWQGESGNRREIDKRDFDKIECGEKNVPGELPSIVIIIMDAARAGNFPQYGHTGDTTPGLNRIIDGFTIYEKAISSSYWTFPSIASLFTGTYLSRHGCPITGARADLEKPLAFIQAQRLIE